MEARDLRVILTFYAALFLFALIISAAVADTQGECPPGSYIINATGSFFCVPAINEAAYTPFVSLYPTYNSTTGEFALAITSISSDDVWLDVDFIYSNGTGFRSEHNIALRAGESREISATIPEGEEYFGIVIRYKDSDGNVFMENYYAYFVGIRSEASKYFNALLAMKSPLFLMVTGLFAVSPLLSFVLTQRAEAGGVALIVASPLYGYVLSGVGLPTELVITIVLIFEVIGIYYLAMR